MAAGHFAHYPASVDDVVGMAAQLREAGEGFRASSYSISQAGVRASTEVAGALEQPVAAVAVPASDDAAALAEASAFAAGAVLLFADAVDAYNRTIDSLNVEYDRLPTPKDQAQVDGLRRQEQAAEATLDDVAAQTSGMLTRGPNDADRQHLASLGLLPSASDLTDPALLSAYASTGHAGSGTPFPPGRLTPEEATAWWASLSLVERMAVTRVDGAALGALDGIPAGARDEANRIALDDYLQQLQTQAQSGPLTADEIAVHDAARRIQEQLAAADAHVDPVTGEPTGAQLLVFEPEAFGGEGRVAIVTGDADTADDVVWNVPGTDSDVSNLSVSRSNAIYDAARDDNMGSRSTAVVTWMGYDAPEWNTSVATEGRAEEGARLLAADVGGLDAARGAHAAHTTVVGHSYGSTTVARAGAEEGLGDHADEIVLVGSPGASSADHASDLGVGEDHVFVGANSSDPVTYLGGTGWVHGITSTLGSDPAEDDFGAVRFQAEAPDRASWVGFGDHSKYFDPGSESLYNIAQVVNGDHGDVTTAEHRYDPWYDEMQDPERDREPGVAPR